MTAEPPEGQREKGTEPGPEAAQSAASSGQAGGASAEQVHAEVSERELSRAREDEPAAEGTQSVSAEEAEHMLTQLFDAVGIKRIVCVDDVFAADFDAFVGQLASFTPEQRALVFDGQAEEYSTDGVWQQRAREAWDAVERAEQASLVDKAYAIAGEDHPVSKGAVHALQRVLPGTLSPIGLSLAQWQARKDALIAETDESPTLILFDQDFSHEGAGSEEGQQVIAELEGQIRGTVTLESVYYGLLTNKVGPEDELERRRQIIESTSLDPQRLVVISKRNLDSEELERFAGRIRSTLLAPVLSGLTVAVTGALAAEQTAAIHRVEGIAPEELERIVIRTSAREGEWPADMLVRVLGAMQRVKVRERLRTAADVERLTSRLQAIAAVPGPAESRTAAPAARSPSSAARPEGHQLAAEIMHEEFYDDAPHVNSLHLPIELGDVIECPSTGQLWVVVAQPCDLMVRGEGKREPELTHTTLAKLRKIEETGKPLFSEFELPYFDTTGESFGVGVQLGRVAYPRAVIIDACVLNDHGQSRLDLQGTPAARLLPHWRRRQGELNKVGELLFKRTGQVKAGQLTDEAVVGHYSGDPFKPTRVDPGAKLIEWDCRRVGRIGEPYARALLTRFTQYQARDAFLNDLAR